MYNGTIIQQGKFTSAGTDKILKIRSDVDWMEVINFTQADGGTQDKAIRSYWQRGMGTTGLVEYHPAADQTLAIDSTAAGAFTLIDTSDSSTLAGAWTAVTAGTNATGPQYSTGTTTGLSTGSIVRLKGTDHTNLNGIDFSIDAVVAATSFDLANDLATAPGVVAGASGYYKLIAPTADSYRLFTPSHRFIANITAAASGVVTTLVDHGYAVGQKVRFTIPSNFGMVELNDLVGTITAVTTSTFTVNINTSGFSAYTFPTAAIVTAAGSINYATVIPVGESTSSDYSANTGDAVYNQGYIGMILAGGALLPAGENTNVIYWRAGKSFSYDNE